MKAILTDCSDHDARYGILTVKNKTIEEVQNKIYELKKEFEDMGKDDWDIDDLSEKFPDDWEYSIEEIPEEFIEI